MRPLRLFNYTSDDEANRSLRNVLLAAVPGTVFFAVIQGTAYTAFVRDLTKEDSFYGFLAALPLITGLFRFASAYLIERYRARRAVFLISLYVQRFVWIPFALIPFMVPDTSPQLRITLAVLCLAMYGTGGALGDVATISWLTDLVPADIRGSYLGQRVRVSQLAGMITPIVVGWYLDAHPGFIGLAVVLIVGAFFGLGDISMWLGVKHPPVRTGGAPLGLGRMFLEPLRLPAYRKLLLFWTTTLFSFGFMSPFLMVYNLEVLHLDYVQASLQLQVIPGVMAFILSGLWGRIIDGFGSKPLLRLCMFGSSFVPVFWILSTPAHPWPQTIANFFGGAIWVGLDMSQMNLMMKILPEENRSSYIAGYGITAWLVGNATASICAGRLADAVRPLMNSWGFEFLGSPFTAYQVLFVISLALRWTLFYLILPRIEEPEAKSTGELLASFRRPRRRPRRPSVPRQF